MRILVGPACFAIFGWLTATHLQFRTGQMVGYALVGALFGIASVYVLSLVLAAVNSKVSVKKARTAVIKGFLLIIPFAILAVLAEMVLRWNAVQAFASVGLMSAGGAAGLEMVKISGRQMVNGIVPAISAVILTLAWSVGAPFIVKLLKLV